MRLRGVLKPIFPIYIFKKKRFWAFYFFLKKGSKNTSISTPKRLKPALLRLNALFAKKSGYTSGYLSQIYLFSCLLDKECLYLSTRFKKKSYEKTLFNHGRPRHG